MRGERNSNISPNPKDEISWQKNTLRNKLLIVIMGMGLLFSLLYVVVFRPSALLGIILLITELTVASMPAILRGRRIPSFVGISENGIYFKHGKTVDYIPWKNVKEIMEVKDYIGRWRVQKRWELFLKEGGVKHINFISRDIIKDMCDEFERYKLREKTE